jgi:hypothetical protein
MKCKSGARVVRDSHSSNFVYLMGPISTKHVQSLEENFVISCVINCDKNFGKTYFITSLIILVVMRNKNKNYLKLIFFSF